MSSALAAAPPGQGSNDNSIQFDGLDPALGAIGQLVGLLTSDGGESYTVNGDWFENPIEKTSAGVTANGDQIGSILSTILGNVAGHALGVPVSDPALLGTWSPIQDPTGDGNPTGLYVVSYQQDGNSVYGLGVYRNWQLTQSPKIQVDVWGLVPLLLLGGSKVQPAFTQPGYPITVGLAVEGADAKPLIDESATYGFQFNGIKVSAGLDLEAATRNAKALDLSLVVLELQLPGDDKASDRSLADLETISGPQILNTASSLFMAAMSRVFPSDVDKLGNVLPILGLTSRVPNSQVQLPILAWYDLFRLAFEKQDVSAPFTEWFTTLTSDSQLLKTWTGCLSGMLGQPVAVTGTGTRVDPFLSPLLTLGTIGTLQVSTATQVSQSGVRAFYPGLHFSSKTVSAGTVAEARIESEFELAQFNLSSGGVAFGSPSSLQFSAAMAVTGVGGGDLLNADGYQIGALHAGVMLGLNLTVIPKFELVKVAYDGTSFDSVDLLDPAQLAQAAEQTLLPAIDQQLKKMLGLTGVPVAFLDGVSALLGMQPPPLPQGLTWPADLAPPFSLAQLPTTYSNPLGSLGEYWEKLVSATETVGTQKPFYYMVSAIGAMLNQTTDGAATITIAGSGVPNDPWTVGLSTTGSQKPASLVLSTAPGTSETLLTLGLAVDPVLSLGGVTLIPSVEFDFLTLRLPAQGSGLPFGAVWAPAVSGSLTLPDTLSTPKLAGVTTSISRTVFSARWSRFESWSWSLYAGAPVLQIDGQQPIPLGKNLDFSNQSSLQDLVTASADAFSPLLISMLGVALTRTGTAAGLAVTSVFGLLPDPSQVAGFPQWLTWPAGLKTQLAIPGASLSNPVPALRSRLAAVLSSTDNATAVISLLDWVINSGVTAAPTIRGSGTFVDPWLLPVVVPGFQFDVPLWYDNSQQLQLAGVGLGVSSINQFGPLTVTMGTRLNLVEVSLATGAVAADSQAPSLSFLVSIGSSSGDLIPASSGLGTLGSLELGFCVTLDSGSLQLNPVVTLVDVELPGESQTSQITLATFQDPSFTPRLQSAFLALLNAGVTYASSKVGQESSFQAAYALLTSLGLTVDNSQGTYGINPAGWQGLLANPLQYARQQLNLLLTDPTDRGKFFEFVELMLGITLPTIPDPVLDLLSSLGFLGSHDLGYPVQLDALLQLGRHPMQTLSSKFETLVTNPEGRQTLVSALGAAAENDGKPHDFGPFSFQLTNGGIMKLGLSPDYQVSIGDVLDLSGHLTFDLVNLDIGATLGFSVPKVGLSLVPTLDYRIAQGSTPDFQLQLVWGDADRPNADPLTLYPFNSTTFLSQLADLAPAYVLSVVATGIMESQLLAKYPLVQKTFVGFGLAQQDEYGNWSMPSLLGLLKDPRGWLLSEGILGENGKFSVAAFGKILSSLPSVQSSSGLGLKAITNGAQIYGLPYNFNISLTSTASEADFTVSTGNLSLAEDYGQIANLSATFKLDADYQPGIAGSLTLATGSKAPAQFYVTGGYDSTFSLEVGEGTLQAPGTISLELVPFQGWGSVVKALLPAAIQYAPQVAQALMKKLFGSKPDAFLQTLSAAGGLLNVQQLVDTLVNDITSGKTDQLESDALAWLLDRATTANLPNTVKAIGDVIHYAVPAATVSDSGLIEYKPSSSLPIVIDVGVNTLGGIQQLGLWVALQLPQTSRFQVQVQPTGVGIPLGGPIKPIFNFGVDVTVPIEGTVGPQLSLDYNASGLSCAFDPLGDAASLGTASSLSVELLPRFFGSPTDLGHAVTTWLLDVVTQVLPRYLSVVILNHDSVKKWLTTPLVDGATSLTPATVLQATSLIVDNNDIFALNSIDNLKQLTVKSFVASFLQALLKTKIRLLRFGEGNTGEIWIQPDPANASAYGVRLVAPGLKVPGLSGVVLQIGAQDSTWITSSGGATTLEPGIAAYVPIDGTGQSMQPHFDQLKLNLVNLGLDFTGSNGKPLIDKTRFKLGAVQPRVLVAVDLAGQTQFGGGVALSNVAISVAPNTLVTGDNANPVAQNLLGSGTKPDSGPPPNNPPTDPTFTVTAAYTKNLWVNLKSSTGEGNEIIIPVQRSFGPLYVGSVGLGWEQTPKILDFLFTGGVSLAGLDVGLQGLTVGIPVTTLTDFSKYTLELKGLDISYEGGPVTITGGFLKEGSGQNVQYVGAATLKASQLSIAAAGGYGLVNGAPSLFIFGALNVPLGDPTLTGAFFITGLAAGFGFNRSLAIPDITGVRNFPLVAGVIDGTFTPDTTPDQGLTALAAVVAPEIGEYWLAAGVKFTSYELLNSFALLFIKFGNDFEIDLLGVTSAVMPPGVSNSSALAYMELALKVSFRLNDGVISAEAQLTPNSFVLTRSCHVTGGFAFYLWFKTIQEPQRIPGGTFVISLGGYHPAFQVPTYFPTVPRLGLSWKIESDVGTVGISGGAYFALVPTGVMAGGYLNAVFDAGPLRAWLDAAADFLIEWHPFYFSVDISITVGVEFHTEIAGVSITLKVSLGAALMLAGPPTHGSVGIDWYVISFSIPFGDAETATTDSYLSAWDDFAQQFLPPPKTPDTSAQAKASPNLLVAAAVAEDPAPQPVQQIVKSRVASGLLDEDAGWKLQLIPFSLAVDSAIPISTLTVASSQTQMSGPAVGVRPMNIQTPVSAPLTVTVLDSTSTPVNLKQRNISLTGITNGSPGALWSQSKFSRDYAPDSSKMVINDTLMGLALDASTYVTYGAIPAFPIESLAYDRGTVYQLPYAVTPSVTPGPAYTNQSRALQALMYTIMADGTQVLPNGTVTTNQALPVLQTIGLQAIPDTISRRKTILSSIQSGGLTAIAAPDLSVMSTSANLVLQAPPVLARIDVYQSTTIAPGVVPVQVSRDMVIQPTPTPARAPLLLSVMRRYRTADAVPETAMYSAPRVPDVRGVWMDHSHTASQPVLQAVRKAGVLKAGLGAANDGSAGAELHPGTHLLWDLDPGQAHSLAHSGTLGMRFCALDENHCLTHYSRLDAQAEAALPQGTQRVLTQGVADDAPHAAGWTEQTVLACIDPYHAVGDGFIVRPNNGIRIWRKRRLQTRTLAEVRTLLDGNQVASGGRQVPGWVMTIFERAWDQFAVIVQTEPNQKLPLVSAVCSESRESFASEHLQPINQFSAGTGYEVLVFRSPQATSPAAGLTVLTQALPSGACVVGVYGIHAIDQLPRNWGGLKAECAAVSVSGTRPVSSTLSLSPLVTR